MPKMYETVELYAISLLSVGGLLALCLGSSRDMSWLRVATMVPNASGCPWRHSSFPRVPNLGGQMLPLRHPDGATWDPEGHPDSKSALNVPNKVKRHNPATHQLHQNTKLHQYTNTPTPPIRPHDTKYCLKATPVAPKTVSKPYL